MDFVKYFNTKLNINHSLCAINTNILLYSLDETDKRKQKIAIQIID